MADYILNGNTRKTTLTVDFKNSVGDSAAGYPKTYSILSGFVDPGVAATRGVTPNTAIAAITNVQLARMTETAYQARLASFYNYVESVNPQLDRNLHVVPGFEPTGTSALCVINTPGDDNPSVIS